MLLFNGDASLSSGLTWGLSWELAIAVAVGYLAGSIPFGLVFTRLAGLGDIRKTGSGNTGATNVLRTGNRKLAALTLLCDMLKGLVAVLVFSILSPAAGIAAGFFAFLGHIFPVWLGFKGGKGVATYLGVLAGVAWPCALLFALIWLATAYISRYSSLSALAGVAASVVFAWFCLPAVISAVVTVMGVIIILKHHSNIGRLCAGTESKIGLKT